jgi:hypothetical protein
VSVKVERHPEPISCLIKASAPTGVAVGDLVEMHCKYTDGKLVLVGLESKKPPAPDDGNGKLSVSGVIAAFDSSSISVTIQGRTEPVTCSLPPGADMLGFAVGDFVAMYCFYDGSHWVLKGLKSDHSVLVPSEGQAYFGLNGVILEVNSTRISIQVEHHPSPVTCGVPVGTDLEGFAVGDSVSLYCRNSGDGFKLLGLKSEHAAVTPEGEWLSFTGTISSLSSSEIGLTVEHHSSPLTCAVPPGVDLSAFATGDTAEMHCHFHDGQFVLASLKTEHASIVLEP